MYMKCKLMSHHSLFSRFFCLPQYLLLSLLCMLVFPGLANAQMFSVGNEGGPEYNIPRTELTVGLEPMTVAYRGGTSGSRTVGLFAFEGPVIRLGYNSPGLDLFLGTGGEITGIEDISYFDVGGNIDFGIDLYRSEKFVARIPVRIASRYVNMVNSRFFQQAVNNYFRFGNLTVGGGAELVARPAEHLRIEVGAIPAYGFAFASGGFFGGSLGSVAAHGRLYLDRLWGNWGLSLGYKYDLRNYDIDENVYDYKITGHTFELGVTF